MHSKSWEGVASYSRERAFPNTSDSAQRSVAIDPNRE